MTSDPINKAFLMAVLCCGALSACDRTPEPPPATTQAPDPASQSSVSTSAVDPMAGLVKAVAADSRQQAIDVRFELGARPQPGERVDLNLTLLGVDDATDVKLTITADQKLSVLAGNDASFAVIKAGEIVTHTVTVRGAETGIFVVDAKLTAMANGGPRTMNYALPVAIVPPASAPGDASGAARK